MSIAELIAVKRFIWLRGTEEGMSRAYVKRWGCVLEDENRKKFLKTREYICVYFNDEDYNDTESLFYSLFMYNLEN
jgi:hypothetical protein